MWSHTRTGVVLAFVLVATTVGCGQSQQYSIWLYAHSGAEETQVDIELAGRVHDFGGGGNRGFIGAPPKKAVVSWTTERDYRTSTIDIPQPTTESPRVTYVIQIMPNQSVRIKRIKPGGGHSINEFLRDGAPEYAVGFKNDTGQKISNLRLYFGEHQVMSFWQISESQGVRSWHTTTGLPFEVTDTAVVRWTTEDNESHKQVVDLTDKFPETLDDSCFVFHFNPSGTVSVNVLKWSESHSWSR